VTSRELVLATANADKAAEIRALLSRVAGISLIERPAGVPEVEEDADTLVGNARLKAVALVRATGKPAVSDDTGLFVVALDGAPGVRSARYASEHASYADNVSQLLKAMAVATDRRAEFRTVALVAFPGGAERWVEGVLRGTIASAPRGSEGFGYDPVFVPEGGGGRTYAEMGISEKNDRSHRALAFAGLVALLGLDWPG
jgi:XTP/dITP diphosphohydrolase